jgi:transposase
MSKRKYTHISAKENEIIAMREAGKSRREIAECLGLEMQQVKGWVTRYNQRRAKIAAGILPRPKGRPRKAAPPQDVVAEQAYEIQRLKMENKLLRDFLQLTERK